MEEEIQGLEAKHSWDLIAPRKACKPIRFKWIYRAKYHVDGSINMYKARLIVKGYAQTHGIDYNKTFALVAKMTTVRTLEEWM